MTPDFEAIARKHVLEVYDPKGTSAGTYVPMKILAALRTAYKAGLQRAAEICWTKSAHYNDAGEYVTAASECAQAIESELKEQPK